MSYNNLRSACSHIIRNHNVLFGEFLENSGLVNQVDLAKHEWLFKKNIFIPLFTSQNKLIKKNVWFKKMFHYAIMLRFMLQIFLKITFKNILV